MTSIPGRSATNRIVWLDGLRGIAATAVVLGHYFESMLRFPGSNFLDPGVFGVGIFFFVSGFIIPASVRTRDRHPLTRFVCARFFRLYPLYWLSLAIGTIVYGAGAVQALVNITMAQRFVGVPDVIGAYWTLEVELLFYGFVVVTILLEKFNSPRVVASAALAAAGLAVILGAVRFFLNVKSPIAVPIGLSLILVGNMYFLLRQGLIARDLFGRVCSAVAGCLLISFCLGYSRDWGYSENPMRFAASYSCSAALFFATAYRGRCGLPVLSGLGLISYPIYLLHQPIQAIVRVVLHDQPVWVVGLAAFVVVLLLAELLHLAIETPGVRLGRWLMNGGGRPAAANPVAPAVTNAWLAETRHDP
jgi:peptidoglycan/LPS O-acetylase OafA/YrhL